MAEKRGDQLTDETYPLSHLYGQFGLVRLTPAWPQRAVGEGVVIQPPATIAVSGRTRHPGNCNVLDVSEMSQRLRQPAGGSPHEHMGRIVPTGDIKPFPDN
jgi:hypothetical protein